MRKVCAIILVALLINSAAMGQKRKKPRTPSRSHTAAAHVEPPATGPRMVGSPVVIITQNNDRIAGTLVDLTAYSIRIKADNLESTVALDRIASLSFGNNGSANRPPQTNVAVGGEFARQAGPVLETYQNVANQLQQGTEFNAFDKIAVDLRRMTELFINRFGGSENPTEARIVALLSAALTDYTWSRTIWRLRLNRSGDTTAFDTDAPALTDALALYPELRAASAVGNKFSVDKVVSALWKKAAEKTERARALAADSR